MPADRLASGRRIQGSDVAAYFHTGGTTGAPKLAIHTHANQVFTAWAAVQLQNAGPGDVVINGYPLFHVAGALPASLAALSAGVATIIPTTQLLRNREVLRNYWRLVERHRATSLQGVPTILAALAEVPLDGADISSLRYCRTGAAPLPAELAARFERQFGLHVNESLGMTEMAGISSISPPGSAFPVNCVGFPLPYVQVRIATLDAAPGRPARDLPPGEAGMVLFKAPNVIPGFVDPADTAQAFTEDGWLISGDIGRLDEQGRLHLQGRAKDRSSGAATTSIPRPSRTRWPRIRPCACALPSVRRTPMPASCRSPSSRWPRRPGSPRPNCWPMPPPRSTKARARRVIVLEQMPMTNVGKIYKPDLRRLAVAVSVQALVAQSLRESGLPEDSPCLRVLTDAQPQVAVQALPDAPAALRARLRETLARLPVSVPLLE